MPTPIGVQLEFFEGVSGTYLIFLKNEGSILNPGGSALTESAAGYFTATITQTVNPLISYETVVTLDGSKIYAGWLLLGRSATVDDPGDGTAGPASPIVPDNGDGYQFLTSQEEIERLFSSDGVDNHLEDLVGDNFATTLNEILVRASERVMLYMRPHYAIADVVGNYWVREQATYIAAHLISLRCGNPSLYTDMFQLVLDDLERVRRGELDPAIKSTARPVVQTPGVNARLLDTLYTKDRRSTRTLPKQRTYDPLSGWLGW